MHGRTWLSMNERMRTVERISVAQIAGASGIGAANRHRMVEVRSTRAIVMPVGAQTVSDENP
ncbi:MAG TPA: hypothetical protein VFS44_09425 [Gemmatimonadaceae bacterium]|nr:hypothetical protein [Gemmatimonadaceae bacterium]